MKIICAIILILIYFAPLVPLIKCNKDGGTFNSFIWFVGAGPFFGVLIYLALR